MWYESLAYKGLIPDGIIRLAIRYQLQKYTEHIVNLPKKSLHSIQEEFIKTASKGPVAIQTLTANSQHYELPTDFYEMILGDTMKYSGSLWPSKKTDLSAVDACTLKTYTSRAQLENGHSVLDIGCGWGSLSLYIGTFFDQCNVTAVTNSSTQENYINSQILKQGLSNVRVLKTDINVFQPDQKFERVLSIEMFEHMRNAKLLMRHINDWLTDEGKLFIQVFTHSRYPQFFDNYSTSWMSRNFFSGGMMPYIGFHEKISGKLTLQKKWTESGMHYHKTLESWLCNLDSSKKQLLKSLDLETFGASPSLAINKFRIFLLFCSELFKYNHGESWQIMNYLFTKPGDKRA
jgi:cyclopropane-fatty-acyl-phospholipid synthase